MEPKNIIYVVGETGSGKSSLAMRLAKEFNGEIIAADSRTVYKGMDIGTAKPSKEDQAEVTHWCLDLVDPSDHFTVLDFKSIALNAVSGIVNRGSIPIVVGGSGLYVQSLLYDFDFRTEQDNPSTSELEKLPLASLQERASVLFGDQLTKDDTGNRRRLVRAIETGTLRVTQKNTLPNNALVIGVALERSELEDNLRARAISMLQNGVAYESQTLKKKYGARHELFKGNAYQYIDEYLEGEYDEGTLVERIVKSDMQLAKKQRTWFKRDPNIEWFGDADAAFARVSEWIKRSS